MRYEEFNIFCESLEATTNIVQWGYSHMWKVGGKVFAIGGWGKISNIPVFKFKTAEQDHHFLSVCTGYRPAPYMASRGMKRIQHYDDSPKEQENLKYYIKESHRIVSLGLTKKKQRELGLNQAINKEFINELIIKYYC
jgi:predicted DNA-binding protein (MmcQ/YjbR family)